MIEFPYGVADFRSIRQENLVYVDRTAYIRQIEALGRTLVFLRPRRFGKSLWIQTLASYYDLRLKDEFDDLFGGLDIGLRPTARRNRYFVLEWDFSTVKPGTVSEIEDDLRNHVASRAEDFARRYRALLPESLVIEGSAQKILDRLLSLVSMTPHKLYLLIDEYDNFVSDVLASDIHTYRALFAKAGPFKLLFKSVKYALGGKGMERAFVTGVSPIALNDLTSGFNNATNISLDPELGALCGFTESDLRDLQKIVASDRDDPSLASEEALDTMRTWYNGYRFTSGLPGKPGEVDPVYNPTSALYFLSHLHRWGVPPERLHDENLRTDQSKLVFLAKTAAGSGVIEQLTEGSGEISVTELLRTFSLDDLIARFESDSSAVASFLYYMGMLSLTDDSSRLRIPNLVVRKLFLDRLLEIYLPDIAESSEARILALRFFSSGDLQPLLTFFESKFLSVLSNRDRGFAPRTQEHSGSGVNEMVMKAFFLAVLFDDTRYVISSELEIERSYIDLCLLVRPERRTPELFDLLFEFKLVRRKTLGKKGEELRGMDDEALRQLSTVKTALTQARTQARRYRERLLKRHDQLNLRSYVVVGVGLERMLGEELVDEGKDTSAE